MIGLALLGCHGHHPAGDDAVPSFTGDTAATGSTCVDTGPCGASLASAVWTDAPLGGWAGYELTAGTFDGAPVVLVGAPLGAPGYWPGLPSVAALDPADLTWRGSFEDDDPEGDVDTSSFGTSLAILSDGSQFAVGAPDGAQIANQDVQQEGTVSVFDHEPIGIEVPSGTLLIHGDLQRSALFGVAIRYMELSDSGTELVAAASSGESDLPAGIFAFDPTMTGEHGLDIALGSISGRARLGQYLAGWDSDGDGLDEVVAANLDGVVHFASPWTTIEETDADFAWTDPDPTNQLGEPLETVGDVDGDGRADLAIGAQTSSGAEVRSGAMYLVPAGVAASSAASDLAYQFLGTELGEGVGSAATSGDYDGDGATDLVIGAYGVAPGEQSGKILGYLGPLTPGVRTPAEADFVVHGESLYDWFGSDVVTVDSDGDARGDLVVGAQGWNQGQGKVYLLLGRDLVP